MCLFVLYRLFFNLNRSFKLWLFVYFFVNFIFTLPFWGNIDNCFTIINVIFPLPWGMGNCFSLIYFRIPFFNIFFIILVIKKVIFLLISSAYFFMLSLALSWFAKMKFSSLTLISIHKSASVSNFKFSELSEDNTSTVRFLYNSVRNFFASVSFLAKKTASGQQEMEIKQDCLNLC